MDERRLAVFVATAQELNFSRAAEGLRLTQPAVSQQIAALEGELDAQLFERDRRSVRLTAAGRALLERAEGILREIGEARRAVSAAQGAVAGDLRVGASLTAGQYVLPRIFARFGKRFPGVRLRVAVENTDQVVRALLDGAADVGFVEGEVRTPGIVLQPFYRDELVVVAPPGHPWSRRGTVRIEDLAHEPIILREPGSGTRQIAETFLRAAGIDPEALQVVAELSGMEAIKGAVEAGLGVSILSRSAVAKEVRLGSLAALPVQGVPMMREMAAATVAGRVLLPAARELVALVQATAGAA